MTGSGASGGQPGGTNGSAGALAGTKVIDLTRVLGGPYATQIMADHGADVIKVEPPQGDEVRDWGPPFHERADGQGGGRDASYFIGVNRNKRALALDLGQPEGRDILLTLLEDADVLIENFKPGLMERWGLDHASLEPRFPRLVHCRISGFGADGPLGGMPGYDAIVQAMAGMFSVNGEPGSGGTRLGVAMVDMGTGLFSIAGVLMALLERERSGRGQFIDMTLYDCALALMHPHFANWRLSGKVPQMTGNAHPNISPYDRFSTATGDIFMGVGNDRAFRRLCERLGVPDLPDDPRFASNGDRVVNREALTAALEVRLADLDGHALAEELLAEGLPCGPVRDSVEAIRHPHTAHRHMNVAGSGEDAWYEGTGTPVKFSRTPAGDVKAPPAFSQHAEEVLAEHGFDAAAIERLRASGVLVEKRR